MFGACVCGSLPAFVHMQCNIRISSIIRLFGCQCVRDAHASKAHSNAIGGMQRAAYALHAIRDNIIYVRTHAAQLERTSADDERRAKKSSECTQMQFAHLKALKLHYERAHHQSRALQPCNTCMPFDCISEWPDRNIQKCIRVFVCVCVHRDRATGSGSSYVRLVAISTNAVAFVPST